MCSIFLACAASISVRFGSKERPRNGIFSVCLRGKWGESPKKEKGVGEGKNGNSFLPSPSPPLPPPSPSFTRSIFRTVILCSRTPQKRLLCRLSVFKKRPLQLEKGSDLYGKQLKLRRRHVIDDSLDSGRIESNNRESLFFLFSSFSLFFMSRASLLISICTRIGRFPLWTT